MIDEREDYEVRARREKLPIPYEIFKGMSGRFGVLSLELREAYTNNPSKTNKPSGIVFLHMTPAIGKNQYAWKTSKISMALGLPDISKIMLYLKNPRHPAFGDQGTCSLIHDRGINSGKERGMDVTYLSIGKPEGKDSYFFNIEKKENGQSVSKFAVPVAPDEAVIVHTLLQAAVPAILSWSPPIKPITTE